MLRSAEPKGAPPAVLFWFYRDAELCENRLRLIRRFNPGCRIYGLYGGRPENAADFRHRLGGLLDDFWAYDGAEDSWWKWINGDLVIRAWYTARGRQLEWRSVFVAQWDMLLLGSLTSILGSPAEDEVILSGLRPVSEVEGWWSWVNGADRPAFEAFMRHLRERHGYGGEAWCCQFVLVCFGRAFLHHYATTDSPELGFLEYRVPTYARLFGMRLSAPRLVCWWQGDPAMDNLPEWRRTLSARKDSVRTRHLLRSWIADGATIVHPYHMSFPTDVRGAVGFVAHGIVERAGKVLRAR
jgi:hypothetical protein